MKRALLPIAWCLVLLAGCATTQPADAVDAARARDAAVVPRDAFAVDAFAEDADAFSAPDAWDGTCPTYTEDVQPIYQLHCATCHTTGRALHFGSSYALAAQPSSACGRTVSVAACTITLGRPGGSMARNDPMGGFTPAELAVLQAWITCGVPN